MGKEMVHRVSAVIRKFPRKQKFRVKVIQGQEKRGRMAQAGTLTCRDRIDEILSSGPRANHELPRIYARSVDEKAKGQRAEHRGSSKGVRTALTVT